MEIILKSTSAEHEHGPAQPRPQIALTRREFLKGAGILTGTLAASSILSALAPSRAWALESTVWRARSWCRAWWCFTRERNSRRIPADKPIHIANMVLDIFPSLVLWRNSILAGAQNQHKTRLPRGTLVIPKCPKMAQSQPTRKRLILSLLRLLFLLLTGPPV